jgi:hypothetical protein
MGTDKGEQMGDRDGLAIDDPVEPGARLSAA